MHVWERPKFHLKHRVQTVVQKSPATVKVIEKVQPVVSAHHHLPSLLSGVPLLVDNGVAVSWHSLPTFRILGGPVFISIWAISPLWLSFGVEAFNLALTINKMLFFPFFCGGQGRGSIFFMFSSCWIFFPQSSNKRNNPRAYSESDTQAQPQWRWTGTIYTPNESMCSSSTDSQLLWQYELLGITEPKAREGAG